jgi:two-component system chemotaxis response regulator CheY
MAMNVLVVDDSGVMRKMIIQALAQSGLPLGHIFESANGQEGLDVVHQQNVDVVLLDLHMPVMNGEEMFNQLRADPKYAQLPVVFITSESSAARIQNLLGRGAGFVHKPWSPEDIRSQILTLTGPSHG